MNLIIMLNTKNGNYSWKRRRKIDKENLKDREFTPKLDFCKTTFYICISNKSLVCFKQDFSACVERAALRI